MDPKLQQALRNNGIITSPALHLQETLQADELRQKVVRHMLTSFSEIHEYMTGEAVNADMPAGMHFSSLEERLIRMAEPSSFVGELEVTQTAAVIQRKVVVVQGNHVTSYGQEFGQKDAVVVFYTAFGDNSGHYRCLVNKMKNPVRLPGLSPIQRRVPVLPSTPAVLKRKRRTERSEVLTSSPYKKRLFETASKQKKQPKTAEKETSSKRGEHEGGIGD